jgi:hypothetical protein
MAQTLEISAQVNQRRTIRRAWLMLIAALAVFCMLLGSTSALLWSYYTHATIAHSSSLILRTSSEWVTVQRKGRTTFERAIAYQSLKEGDQVRIISSAGYGQAATLRLPDDSTLDMWAGASLELEQVAVSRWTNREQTFVLHQREGYVRYDLKPRSTYQQKNVRVRVGVTTITLAPGGSYSIAVSPDTRHIMLLASEAYEPVVVDVAARAGEATVQGAQETVTITAGQRVTVDAAGTPATAMPAAWQLIDDGCFNHYDEEEYNNTTITDQPALPRSHTWKVFSGPPEAGASGFFKLSQSFALSDTVTLPQQDEPCHLAWFLRTGGQTTGFTTGVRQMLGRNQLGIDISEYHSLTFSAWVRVLNQSIDLAGEQGTECPVMIRFIAKQNDPTDAEQKPVMCLYTSEDPNRTPVHAPGVSYHRLEPYQWHHVQIELRSPAWFPNARYLQSIEIYANGHDYNAHVSKVSLIGTHFDPDNQLQPVLSEIIR